VIFFLKDRLNRAHIIAVASQWKLEVKCTYFAVGTSLPSLIKYKATSFQLREGIYGRAQNKIQFQR
jgi:hypothetical protein